MVMMDKDDPIMCESIWILWVTDEYEFLEASLPLFDLLDVAIDSHNLRESVSYIFRFTITGDESVNLRPQAKLVALFPP